MMRSFSKQVFAALGFQACEKFISQDQPWPEVTLVHPNELKFLDYHQLQDSCEDDTVCDFLSCLTSQKAQIICSGCDEKTFKQLPDSRQIAIDGNQSAHQRHDLELSAVWPDTTSTLIKKTQVLFVDADCDPTFFQSTLNQKFTYLLGISQDIQVNQGFQKNRSDACGAPTFQLQSDFLELVQQDQTLFLRYKPDNGGMAGNHKGKLMVSFKNYQNGRSVIEFDYNILCLPNLEHAGLNGTQFQKFEGEDLQTDLGVFQQIDQCQTEFETQLIAQDNLIDGFYTFDQPNKTLHVYGRPPNLSSSQINFIYTASIGSIILQTQTFQVQFLPDKVYEGIDRRLQFSTTNCNTAELVTTTAPNNITVTFGQPAVTFRAFRTWLENFYSTNYCGPRVCSADLWQPDYITFDETTQMIKLETLDTGGRERTVRFTCSLKNYPSALPVTKSIVVSINKDDPCLMARMYSYYIAPISLTQGYTTTYVDAFPDSESLEIIPYKCGKRTCSSNHNNVVWDDPTQQFQVKTLGTQDVPGTYTVSLTCGLAKYPERAAHTRTFTLTILAVTATCSVSNSIQVPILPDIAMDQTYSSTTINAYGDVFSGSTSPPTCGPRTCSSDHANVVWSDSSQIWTVQSLGSANVIGVHTITLTCSLTNHQSVAQASQTFKLTISNCVYTAMSVTGTPKQGAQVSYVIDTAAINLPITISWTPSACTYPSFNYYIDSNGADVSWVASLTATNIRIFTNDFNRQTLTIPLRYWAIPVANPSQNVFYETFTLIVTNPCLTWNDPAIANTNILVALASSQYTTFSLLKPTYQASNATLNCGAVTYAITPSQPSYLTLITGSTEGQISATASSQDVPGTFDFNLVARNTQFNQVKTLPFQVTISACQTTVTFDPTISGSLTLNIFQAAKTFPVSTFVQTPNCQYVPSFTLSATQTSPTQGTAFDAPFWTINSQKTQLSLFSEDSNLHQKTFQVKYDAQIGVQTKSQSISITWIDPCLSTELIATALQNQFGFINGSAVNTLLPWLNDDTNVSYGQSTQSSICGDQTVQVTENSVTPDYITITKDSQTGRFQLSFQSQNLANKGVHVISVKYSLTKYPAKTKTNTFEITLYELIAPAQTKNSTYQVKSAPLVLSIPLYQINPANPQLLEEYTAQLSGGQMLPQFITFTKTAQSVQFSIETQDNSVANTYLIEVKAKFTLAPLPAVTQTHTFQLKVTPSANLSAVSIVSYPPVFTEPLQGPFSIPYGTTWVYNLPPKMSPQNLTVTTKVDLAGAINFLQFSQNTLSIGQSTLENVGNYTIAIVLEDSEGKTTAYSLQIQVKNVQNTQFKAGISTVNQENSTNQFEQNYLNWTEKAVSFYNQDVTTLISAANQQYPNETLSVFDWMSLYRKSLLKGRSKSNKYPEPDVFITKIDHMGVVTFVFTNQMFIPPLEYINNASIPLKHRNLKQGDKRINAFQMRPVPGKYSQIKNLTFSYKIIEFSKYGMKVQMNFTNYLAVSVNDDPDWVEVQFPGNFYFFDIMGNVIPQNKALRMKLPVQMPLTAATRALAVVTQVASAASNGIMATNMFLNVILSASLQQLWSMVNTQQIVVLMPLWTVQLPSNAAMFYEFIMQIASFDLIDMMPLWHFLFPNMPATKPISSNFDAIGFNDLYFIHNSGTIILFLFLWPILLLSIVFMTPCTKVPCIVYLRQKLKNMIFWDSTIKFITETYTILVMCVLVNTLQFKFSTPGQITSSSFTLFVGILVIIVPLIVCICIYKNFDKLNTKILQDSFGSTYKALDLKRGKIIILQKAFYYTRRVLIPMSVVYNKFIIIQIYLMVMFVIAQVFLVGFVKPIEGGVRANRMEMVNEIFVMQIMYTFMCFTDFVPLKQTQFYVGYVSCGLVISHLILNIGFMAYGSARLLLLKLKRYYIMFLIWWKKKQSKKQLQVAPNTTENNFISKKAKKTIVKTQQREDLEQPLEKKDDPYSLRRLQQEFEDAKKAGQEKKHDPDFETQLDKIIQDCQKWQQNKDLAIKNKKIAAEETQNIYKQKDERIVPEWQKRRMFDLRLVKQAKNL